MRKRFVAVAALLFIISAALLAGCSSSGSKDTLDEIKARGEVTFAMSGGYPPFNYYDENDKLVGFDVDIAAEVAKRMGVKFKPVTTAWDGILEGLVGGRYDAILGSMAITPQRLERVDFSDPYYLDGSQMLVRKDSPYTRAEDLKGKSIAIANGTTFADDAKTLGITDVKTFEDDNQTLQELRNDRVQGVITGYFVAVNAVKQFPNDFKLAGPRIREEQIAVAIRKNNPKFVEAVNKALKEMREDGTYARISEKWFGRDISK
ncbi:MAG: ABC transporter substrate-binding protein [Bacillota bacterium]